MTVVSGAVSTGGVSVNIAPYPRDIAVIKPGSGGGDRRRECRYPAVLQNAVVGWWQESSFTNVPARLVDLSLNGCRLELDRLRGLSPPRVVWVHLYEESQLEWVEGRIIAVRKRLLRKCEVRVLFKTPLGYEPFKKLVYGPEHLCDPEQKATPEHEWDQFWR